MFLKGFGVLIVFPIYSLRLRADLGRFCAGLGRFWAGFRGIWRGFRPYRCNLYIYIYIHI